MNNRYKIAVLFDVISIGLTILLCVATVLSYFAPFISPDTVWWIAFLGLGGQLLILAVVIVSCYWIARMKWIAFLPLAVLIAGVEFWGDFYKMPFSKQYQLAEDSKETTESLTIMTYNVRNFDHSNDSFTMIATLAAQSQADIICFQEFGYASSSIDSASLESMYSKYTHKTISSNMAVFSKYPLYGAKIVRFHNTTNNALKTEIAIDDNMITLYNIHLQTTEFNQASGGGVQAIVEKDNSSEIIRIAGGAMKRNYIARVEQVDSLVKMFKKEINPIIVAGDLNDTPMSYAYSSIVGDRFYDGFNECGSGYGYSYRSLLRLFRIDYIFCQKNNFDIISYNSPDVDYSDHNPVIVKFKIVNLE